ncbi:hypothetical protein EW146_g6788 [Bondarzewia mesenterica]|uniref:Ribosome biogenesis protein NSA1 n=1 Tax=Bondarzewia mesenterica TaxID=1095465 RepID=A0A4S4LMJ8_9AGAM|nr:hypothetical protein EW146_g6788 [Bondarzewia mesenterica]
MPRFLTGDELGNIKSLKYTVLDAPKAEISTLYTRSESGKEKCIQALTVAPSSQEKKIIAAAHADGSASALLLNEDDSLETLCEWKEPRLRTGQKYVGLAISPKSVSTYYHSPRAGTDPASRGIYSCTSNGALRLTILGEDELPSTSKTSVLPMRLCEWRLSSDGTTFAYGGEEVELSIWDVERAFASGSPEKPSVTELKKRKRGSDLLPGELWRAKNVANDSLSLRQPVHNTCLTFLKSSASASSHHLLVGTLFGNVRRYDTRSARRPVADWQKVAKLEELKGSRRVSTSSLSGAVTSLAPSPTFLASTALDRYARVHSIFAPPAEPGLAQEHKGEVLEKIFMKSVPTAVVWDQDTSQSGKSSDADEGSENGDDVWEGMESVGDDEENEDSGLEDERGKRKGSRKMRVT